MGCACLTLLRACSDWRPGCKGGAGGLAGGGSVAALWAAEKRIPWVRQGYSGTRSCVMSWRDVARVALPAPIPLGSFQPGGICSYPGL